MLRRRHSPRKDLALSPDGLVVGLGNPGPDFVGTRHNIGFDVADACVERLRGNWRKSRSRASIADVTVPGATDRILLAKPQVFMNVSGESVKPLVAQCGVDLDHVLVIHDDIDLAFGELRFKSGGGSGGHNGLKSIARLIGPHFARLRFGVGRPPGQMDPAAFVLRRFSRPEQDEVAIGIETAVDMIFFWQQHGLEATQNEFH